MGIRFAWDSHKATQNYKKHGVTFTEAMSVFRDRTAYIVDDDDHSVDEYRELIIGTSNLSRLLIVSFTERGEVIRVISARKANQREKEEYEKAKR